MVRGTTQNDPAVPLRWLSALPADRERLTGNRLGIAAAAPSRQKARGTFVRLRAARRAAGSADGTQVTQLLRAGVAVDGKWTT